VLKLEADNHSPARLRLLVAGAVRAPEDDPPEGASPAELAALADQLGQPLPPALRTWLSICNGAAIGPGGVFGQRPDRRFLDMAWLWDLYPEWRGPGWIPVASDGCGNYYVLTADGTVGFVETMSDPAKLARQAAPDLLSFMTGLLAADQSP
jgi:hypothetical protein